MEAFQTINHLYVVKLRLPDSNPAVTQTGRHRQCGHPAVVNCYAKNRVSDSHAGLAVCAAILNFYRPYF
jgi:hypothetical protein